MKFMHEVKVDNDMYYKQRQILQIHIQHSRPSGRLYTPMTTGTIRTTLYKGSN